MEFFVQIPNLESTKELKEWIVKRLPDRMFKLILYNPNDYEGNENEEMQAIANGKQFPIQANTCKIVTDANVLALAFDVRPFLKTCISIEKWESLNKNKKQVEKICKKIEDVLGEVPAVDELRGVLIDYQIAINNMFNYHEK